jgi:modulator of FtsH protease
MQDQTYTSSQTGIDVIAINKVMRNTYLLLSFTLVWSAIVAGVAMAVNAPPLGIIGFLIGAYGTMFLVHKYKNSVMGLVWIFAFTGIMGYSLGPLLNMYLRLENGGMVIMQALGGTGAIFLALSAYALVSRKDFSFLSGFIFIGFCVLLGAVIASFFFNVPGLHLAISAGFILFASACILFQTGQIIHGGERNYITATITLYVAIYNIFVSLLNLLSSRD